ncbi:MAG: ATP-binding protein [Erysipelotrichaceae bacterium]
MIGRKKEKEYLLSLLEEEEPQFVAVFGRRRVGKTYLVRETFNHSFTFQHTGISNNDIETDKQKKVQLDKFGESLRDAGYKGDISFNSWFEGFDALKELIKSSKQKKKIIFIDELPWMDTRNSGLISALESFWNGFVTARPEKDVVLIVCASATYWMIDNIVNSRGGLHNRLTGQIHLKPFTLRECEEYIVSRNIVLNRYQILQCYMIMGGIPYYWSLLKKGKSLPQNIDMLFFEEGAPLGHEYENLYSALFNKPEQYMKIVEALSDVNKGISRDEICTLTGIASSGDLTRKLMELENCGFIRKYVPFGYKAKNCLYQLVDNYTLFYYRFIKDSNQNSDYWQDISNTPKIYAWLGNAFERVCLEHIAQIKSALGISGVHTEVNSWHCHRDEDNGIFGSQIDLLIVRRDQIINICEMKYSESEYMADARFDRDMRRKISDFKKKTETKYAVHPILITTYGLEANSYSGSIQAVITADDLFSS